MTDEKKCDCDCETRKCCEEKSCECCAERCCC